VAILVEGAEAPLAVARVGCPLVTVSSPKGGVGKTTIARGLLVRATQLGVRAVGIDFDPQLGLKKWADQRQITRKAFPTFVEVRVTRGGLDDWRDALKDAAADAEVVIADTPPSVEAHMTSIAGLLKTSTYVLIPTGYTSDDLSSVIPWLKEMSRLKIRSAAALNRVLRRTKAFQQARTKLVKAGAVVPLEVPLLEDIHVYGDQGLSVLDVAKASGADLFEALWDHTAREIGL
jgi:chromosome partitioning protein